MRIKKIKELLKTLYIYALHDGIDINRGSHDRFFGNTEARFRDRDLVLKNTFNELKKLLNP